MVPLYGLMLDTVPGLLVLSAHRPVTWAASPSRAGEPLAAEDLVDDIDQRPP
jgi:hypothetical protein